jgi:hypothetical protein
MSEHVQENTVVVVTEEPAKKTKGRKPRGGAGDKPVKEKKVKPAKVVPVSKTWNAPTKHTSTPQTLFLKHIHALIKELSPELLEKEDIRDEYNSLVEYLSQFTRNEFITWPVRSHERYRLCRNMDEYYKRQSYYTFLGGYGSWQDVKNYDSPLKKEIDGRWVKFWELISPTILAPLRRAYFEKEIRGRIRNLQEIIVSLDKSTEERIAAIRQDADNKRSSCIKRITELLKYDPDNTECV